MQPAASTASARVPRVPADLIFVIIAWCEGLETQRDSTLAALCLLSRQYKSAAQRGLYSHLDLDRARDSPNMVKDTGLETLIKKRELRPYVKHVTGRHVFEQLERAGVQDLFEDLPGVEVLAGTANPELLRRILGQSGVHITSLEFNIWNDAAAQLINDYSEAFEALERLSVVEFDTSQLAPIPLEHVKTLSVPCELDPDDLSAFTASFGQSLRRLNLTTVYLLEKLDITRFPRVDKLNIDFSPPNPFRSNRDAQRVAAVLKSTTNLVSLGLWGSVPAEAAGESGPLTTVRMSVHRSPDPETVSFGPSAAPTSAILDALPASLKHLAIVADELPAWLLAPYLLEPLRPSSLATLRLGGRLGRELGDMLRDRGAAPGRGPVGALAGELERAGIELTTTARGVW